LRKGNADPQLEKKTPRWRERLNSHRSPEENRVNQHRGRRELKSWITRSRSDPPKHARGKKGKPSSHLKVSRSPPTASTEHKKKDYPGSERKKKLRREGKRMMAKGQGRSDGKDCRTKRENEGGAIRRVSKLGDAHHLGEEGTQNRVARDRERGSHQKRGKDNRPGFCLRSCSEGILEQKKRKMSRDLQ